MPNLFNESSYDMPATLSSTIHRIRGRKSQFASGVRMRTYTQSTINLREPTILRIPQQTCPDVRLVMRVTPKSSDREVLRIDNSHFLKE